MPDCRSDELHVKEQTTILSFYLPLHLEVLLDDYQHTKTLVIKRLCKYLITIYHYLNSTYCQYNKTVLVEVSYMRRIPQILS